MKKIRGEDGITAHVIHPKIGQCCVLEKDFSKFPELTRQKLEEVIFRGESYFFVRGIRAQRVTREDGSIAFDGEIIDTIDFGKISNKP